MSDYTMENFADVPTAVDSAAWSILNLMGEITLQHVILGAVALFLLIFLVRHKRIMSEVRASLLTAAGVISGAIHAVIAIGLYKVIW
jgi:hypothetical protein